MDEVELIKKAQSGHRLSMNMLLESNYKMLFGFLVKLTADEELAKDLTQETMMKAVMHINHFRGDSKFSSWLIRIGINHYKNISKKKKIDRKLIDQDMVSRDNIEEQLVIKDELRRINQYLNGVKATDRIIFTLKFYEGYDYKTIAQITGVKLGTCKSKMHYLVNKLKLELEVSE